MSFDRFIENLKKKGWKHLDSGYYADVYKHPEKNTVLKIYKEDEAYDSFVNKIKKLKNPYFPKIYNIKNYSDAKEDECWTVVELEKLQGLAQEKHITSKIFSKQLKYGDTRYIFEIDLSYFVNEFNYEDSKYKKDKALIEAIKIINDLALEFSLDLHSDNTMLRKNKKDYQVVFIDPIHGCKRPLERVYA